MDKQMVTVEMPAKDFIKMQSVFEIVDEYESKIKKSIKEDDARIVHSFIRDLYEVLEND
ncbi:hypothetical protein G7084_00185 [Weissella coleopterorum]|uniref:Uncharacterized protein n=1 Tax=Weissella coleopterorum TaxID=2714949 RepID=A0A6G8AXT8_9LACO|nr:hypothetical protein [Weissella coleopterorum]QIL49878.1 hypothetical protein G7084_00185 [Weissella coleopterorum]